MTVFHGRVDGVDAGIRVDSDGLTWDADALPWHRADTMARDSLTVTFGVSLTDSEEATALSILTVSHLGPDLEDFVREAGEARQRGRRRALALGDDEPLRTFTAHVPDDVAVEVLPLGLLVEPMGSLARFVPWAVVTGIERDGYRFAVTTRVEDPCSVSGLGARSDEFERVARAAWASGQANGWAEGGSNAVGELAAFERGDEVSAICALASEMRAGHYREGDSVDLRFLLAMAHGRAVLEVANADDRATLVFGTADLDRVNAALLHLCFHRELLTLPARELGQWGAALRTQPLAAWLRGVTAARVVHDQGWGENLRRALNAPSQP